ncbi:aspartyl-phosphate phosphatase Spo0E family protein [Paenibacillus larvae]|uniref:Spo0E like sporulation regulatory protein n=1 Tax=Paenibacillus larvae subsp. larvae TaxID=147375 RepID=A0A2L1U7Q5_9BACL|nr:aspartyl-phosphate phosphatase Spo0E family protein [Paenibacillus larvae]AVF28969.1 Spo0E like sporulation regulatory protein [Paenibacillus larvae subsp. larvae]
MKPNKEETTLQNEIECIRLELNDLGTKLNILHPDVLAKSQQLDELIVKAQTKKPTA